MSLKLEGTKMELAKTEDSWNYSLGIVYSPNEEDTDGHMMEAVEIRKAQWKFMQKIQGEEGVNKVAREILHEIVKASEEDKEIKIDITEMDKSGISKTIKDMHSEERPDATIVECYLAPTDFEINGEVVKKGSMMLGVVWSDDMFDKILSGERTGYSLGGRGVLVEKDESKGGALAWLRK